MPVLRIVAVSLLAPAPSPDTVPPHAGDDDEVERRYAGPDAPTADDDDRSPDTAPEDAGTAPGDAPAHVPNPPDTTSPTEAPVPPTLAGNGTSGTATAEPRPGTPPATGATATTAGAPDAAPKVEVGLTRGLRVEAQRASVHLGFFTQVHAELLHDDTDGTRGAFRIPFARPYLEISFLDGRLGVFVQAELAHAPPNLLDVAATAELYGDALTVRFGQFRPPTSPPWLLPPQRVSMIGRGVVDDAFRLDRSLGAVLEGTVAKGRFDYHAGVFGPPVGGLPTGGRSFPIYLVRLATSPLGPAPLTQTPIHDGVERGRFVIGTHAWATKLESDIPGTDMGHDETWTATVGADVQILVRRAYVLGEGFVRINAYDRRYDDGSREEGTDVFGGAQLQLGVFVWKDLVEIQARAGTLTHPDFPPVATSFQGGVAVYPFGNHLRVQAYVSGCTDPVNGDPYACSPLRSGIATQIWF